jgi:hypothetical protein
MLEDDFAGYGSICMSSAVWTLIRDSESWRGLRFNEFEQRQLDAVRKDLDAEQ